MQTNAIESGNNQELNVVLCPTRIVQFRGRNLTVLNPKYFKDLGKRTLLAIAFPFIFVGSFFARVCEAAFKPISMRYNASSQVTQASAPVSNTNTVSVPVVNVIFANNNNEENVSQVTGLNAAMLARLTSFFKAFQMVKQPNPAEVPMTKEEAALPEALPAQAIETTAMECEGKEGCEHQETYTTPIKEKVSLKPKKFDFAIAPTHTQPQRRLKSERRVSERRQRLLT